MLKEERYDKILEILEKEMYISAHKLAQRLYVSMPTIRRDLAELSKRNLIVRSHGGAKRNGTEHSITPVNYRKSIHSAEKKKIAKGAAEFVQDNAIIFIDASTTSLYMGEFLSKKTGITVVTNGIPLSIALAEKGVKTYCTGGEILRNSLGYTDSFALEFVKRFNFDFCFFSCAALSYDGMISDTSLEENLIRLAAIENSIQTIFLCDSSKFGIRAPYNLLNIKDISCIITDVGDLSGFTDTNKFFYANNVDSTIFH